jgi:D-amino-acid dehydrogenase
VHRIFEGFFMRIAVIGAGIVGITSAYELAMDGHSVTLFDQSNAAAENASFAPSGLIAPSLLHPFALSARAPLQWQRFASNFNKLSNLRYTRPSDLQWLWQWSQHGAPDTLKATVQSLQSLYHYSMERMTTISSHARLEYEHNNGQIAIVRHAADEALLRPQLDLLKECGTPFKELSRNECLKLEPALALSTEFQTGIHFPNDATANCRQFAMLLKAELARKQTQFQFNQRVLRVQATPTPGLIVQGVPDVQYYDHIVLCAGTNSARLLPTNDARHWRTASISAHTLTLPIRESTLAPVGAIWDVQNSTTIHRLGQRIRICSGAEFGTSAVRKNSTTINRLYQILEQLFPGAALHQVGEQVFKGSQLVSSTGLPLIGASALPGIWLNAGHGFHGWGTACGSAKIIADLIAKKEPEIATQGFHAL